MLLIIVAIMFGFFNGMFIMSLLTISNNSDKKAGYKD